jgi:hypothetical protein
MKTFINLTRKILQIILVFFLTQKTNAQVNLVPNPSFDNLSPSTACPQTVNQWPLCTSWHSVNGFTSTQPVPCGSKYGTPDYFNTCQTNGFAPNTSQTNGLNTHTGSGLMRLALYNNFYSNYREYISAPLNCNMIPGITYSISFWSSTGLPANTINHVGVGLSNGPLTQTCSEVITNANTVLQTNTSNSILSTWTLISFTHTPTTILNRITLGSFSNDASNSVSNSNAYGWYFFDDISVKPISSFSLTTSILHAGCNSFGSATVSPSNANLTYTYLWLPGNHFGSSVSNLAPGTYTVYAAASDGGCNTFNASTIVTINSFQQIPLNPTNYTYCSNSATSIPITVNTTFTAGTISYTWQPNNLNGQTINVNPNTFTTYTLSVTSPSGCPNSTTLSVNVNTNCCSQSTVGLTALNSISGSYANNSYFVANNITVGNSSFQDAEILMMPNVKITVPNGVQLDLDHVHLYACGVKMWQGIEIQDGGKITTSNVRKSSNLIEDAIVGIELDNISSAHANPPIFIDNTIFNNNNIGIKISNGSTLSSLPLKISECVFTSRALPFSTMVSFAGCNGCWPQADWFAGGLRTPFSTSATMGLLAPFNLQGHTPSTNLKSPFNSNPCGQSGILIQNIGNNLGNTINTGVDVGLSYGNFNNNYNLFDNLGTGIEVQDASLVTINNVFQNMQSFTSNGAIIGGEGIKHSISGLMNAKLNLSPFTNVNTDGNKFWNCWQGVNATNVYDMHIEYGIFRSNRNVFSGNGPGMYGINASTNKFLVNIKYNEFNNIDNNVNFNLTAGNYDMNGSLLNGTYADNLDISQNYFGPEVNSTNQVMPNTEYSNYAITLNGASASNWQYVGAGVLLSNKIDRAYRGIASEFFASYSLEIGGNNIRISDDYVVAPTMPQYGIYAKHSDDNLLINQNEVIGDTPPSNVGAWNQNLKCVISEHNQSATGIQSPIITCNKVSDAYLGFEFIGSQPNTNWFGNTMAQKMNIGLSLVQNGEIGVQGSLMLGCGDYWDDNFNFAPFTWSSSNNYETYVDGTSNASPGSFLWCAAPGGMPMNNGSLAPGSQFQQSSPASLAFAKRGFDCTYINYPNLPSQRMNEATLLSKLEAKENKIIVFPNPSNGKINIQTLGESEELKITLTDITGKIVLRESAKSSNYLYTINLPQLQSIYFLEVIDDKMNIKHEKIILNK